VNTTNPGIEGPSVDVAAHVAEIATKGFTVVRDAIEPDLVDALDDDLRRIEHDEGIVPAGNDFEGAHTIRIYNLLARGEVYGRIPVHRNVLPIVEGVLDAGCLVSSLSSISIDPGEHAQPIHADDQLIPLAKPHAPTVCNTMWALTDFTAENGATRLVPRSHLLDHSPHYGGTYDTVPAEMPRGSVLVWHGSLWHGGGTNRSDGRRVGVAMNYCAGFIRQQENQQLGIPAEVARTFSPRLRELCGFGIYAGLIGHIDKRPPSEVVLGEQTPADAIVWDA
jgi:ectoine hydroxylase-related dioxygenase (phytanoyl-CoA dioxygenase family)